VSGRDLPRSDFDVHARDFEGECMRGVSLSGESKAYFARGRIAYLRRWWQDRGRREPSRIVDFGCGIGDVTVLLAEAFPNASVVGVDPSRACLERARSERATGRVRFALPEELHGEVARGSGLADLIHLSGVVHHVPAAERPALFERLSGLLAPDGAVALFENNPWNPGTRLVMARIPFDRDAEPVTARRVRRLLRDAGLAPVETAFLFYFPAFARGLRPLERWLTRLPLGAQYFVAALRAGA